MNILTFCLTFFLAYPLTFCLAYILTYFLAHMLTFFLTFYLAFFGHSIWHLFWHSILLCYLTLYSRILSGIYYDILSDMGTAGPQPRQCPLRSGARGWGRRKEADGRTNLPGRAKKTKEPLVFPSPRPKSAQSPIFWGGIYASLGSYTIISVPGNPNLAPTAWRLEGVEPYTETRQTLDEAGSWVKPHKENHGKWAKISKICDHFSFLVFFF